jgi:hypothetical protein
MPGKLISSTLPFVKLNTTSRRLARWAPPCCQMLPPPESLDGNNVARSFRCGVANAGAPLAHSRCLNHLQGCLVPTSLLNENLYLRTPEPAIHRPRTSYWAPPPLRVLNWKATTAPLLFLFTRAQQHWPRCCQTLPSTRKPPLIMQRLPQRVDDVDRAPTMFDQPTLRRGRRPRACDELDGRHRWDRSLQVRRRAPRAGPRLGTHIRSSRLGSALVGVRGRRRHAFAPAPPTALPGFVHYSTRSYSQLRTAPSAYAQSVGPDLALSPHGLASPALAPLRQPSPSAAPSAGGRPPSGSMADPARSDRAWPGLPGPSDGPPPPGT